MKKFDMRVLVIYCILLIQIQQALHTAISVVIHWNELWEFDDHVKEKKDFQEEWPNASTHCLVFITLIIKIKVCLMTEHVMLTYSLL